MMKMFSAITVAALAFATPAISANYTMQGDVLVISGQIENNDDMRMTREMENNPRSIELNSTGGKVEAAINMANMIRSRNIPVFVGSRDTCASACFLLFAAGSSKTVEPGAKIGVHRVSNMQGGEVSDGTVMMADLYAKAGVPASIIGKMASTPPGVVAWLTPNDLREMTSPGGGDPYPSRSGPDYPVHRTEPGASRYASIPPIAPTYSPPTYTPAQDSAEKWRQIADNAVRTSASQNGGKPITSKTCDDAGICQNMVFFRDDSSHMVLVRAFRTANNKIFRREECIFNSNMTERNCRDFDTGAARHEFMGHE